MTSAIDALRERLLAVDESEPPVLTATFDLAPSPTGQEPSAIKFARNGLRDAAERYATQTGSAPSVDQEEIVEVVRGAIADGAAGLLYIDSPTDLYLHLQTPYAFRDSIHLGSRPWLFEVERYRALYGRAVSVALTDLHSLHLVRLRHGEPDGAAAVEFSKHDLTRGNARAREEGRGGLGPGMGGHSINRLQKWVEEHREMFAREAAERLVEVVGRDDVFFVAGVQEARSQLLHHLPESLAARAIEAGNLEQTTIDSAKVVDLAAGLAVVEQYARAEEALARCLGGALGDRAVTGIEPVRAACVEGRLAQLVLHEDAVAHFGNAQDTRDYRPPGDESAIESLLRDALRQSAEVLFSRDRALLLEHEGVAGELRW